MRWYPVRVYFPEEGILAAVIHDDWILGRTPLDALRRAMRNWPRAVWVEIAEKRIFYHYELPQECRKCRYNRKSYCAIFGRMWIPSRDDCLFRDVIYD
jgi:hypothetical protein